MINDYILEKIEKNCSKFEIKAEKAFNAYHPLSLYFPFRDTVPNLGSREIGCIYLNKDKADEFPNEINKIQENFHTEEVDISHLWESDHYYYEVHIVTKDEIEKLNALEVQKYIDTKINIFTSICNPTLEQRFNEVSNLNSKLWHFYVDNKEIFDGLNKNPYFGLSAYYCKDTDSIKVTFSLYKTEITNSNFLERMKDIINLSTDKNFQFNFGDVISYDTILETAKEFLSLLHFYSEAESISTFSDLVNMNGLEYPESFNDYDKDNPILIPKECIHNHNTNPREYVLKLKDGNYKYTFFVPKNKTFIKDGNIFLDTDTALAYQYLEGIKYPIGRFEQRENIYMDYRDWHYPRYDIEHLIYPKIETEIIEKFNKLITKKHEKEDKFDQEQPVEEEMEM